MPAPFQVVVPTTLRGSAEHPDVWRANRLAHSATSVLASGYPALDAQLPGGGWPVGAMTELLQVQPGWGEWGLLLPALGPLLAGEIVPVGSGVARAPNGSATGRLARACVVLVGAPHAPLAPALQARGLDAQRLLWVRADAPAARSWACEQALRCADVAAVLAWLPQVRTDALRRLHLAAHDHAKLLWVLRPAQAQHESSPAPLRLLLEPATHDACAQHEGSVRILKRRGPPLEQPVPLLLHSAPLRALLAAARARAAAHRDAAASVTVTALRPLLIRGVHALDRLAAAV